METQTIETTLSLKQLLTEFREAYRRIKKNTLKYRKVKGAAKLPYLVKIQHYTGIANATIKKLEAKLVRELEGTASHISNEIIKNPTKVYSDLMPEFHNFDEFLEKVENDGSKEMKKSNDLRYLARGIRKRIFTIKDDTKMTVKKQVLAARNRQLVTERVEQQKVVNMEEYKRQKALRKQQAAPQQRRAA